MNRIKQLILILIGLSVLIEGLFIKSVWQAFSFPTNAWVGGFSIALFVYFIVVSVLLLQKTDNMKKAILHNTHYHASGVMILNHIPKLITGLIALTEDIISLIIQGIYKIFNSIFNTDLGFTRQYYLIYVALGISMVLFFLILYGIVFGRFRFSIHKNAFPLFSNSEQKNPLRLVQISDIHIGSFKGHRKQFIKAIQKINSLNPDIVCFTGDLVNIFAEEADPFIDDLRKIKALKGKFAILGNHDYGEYYPWPTKEDQNNNLEKLKKNIVLADFVLLENEHVTINHKKSQFVLAGVENWGSPPFPQYGDIDQALKDKPEDLPVLLLSHDPTHWDHLMKNGHDIRLTLSGHTHGMQFGIHTKWLKWSPVKFRYPKWTGMYNKGNSYLYINKGLGFIGFPGRVGIWPEITLFELS